MRWAETRSGAGSALAEALRLQRQAADQGFDWPALGPLWDKLAEEIDELKAATEAQDPDAIRDELGDLLFMLVNLCRFLDTAPEQALRGSCEKFIRRLQHVERELAGQGRALTDAGMAELEALWQRAKTAPDPPPREQSGGHDAPVGHR